MAKDKKFTDYFGLHTVRCTKFNKHPSVQLRVCLAGTIRLVTSIDFLFDGNCSVRPIRHRLRGILALNIRVGMGQM